MNTKIQCQKIDAAGSKIEQNKAKSHAKLNFSLSYGEIPFGKTIEELSKLGLKNDIDSSNYVLGFNGKFSHYPYDNANPIVTHLLTTHGTRTDRTYDPQFSRTITYSKEDELTDIDGRKFEKFVSYSLEKKMIENSPLLIRPKLSIQQKSGRQKKN